MWALTASTVLPSSRQFALDLGVSRGVVTDAYDQLVSEGYLDGQAAFPPSLPPSPRDRRRPPNRRRPDGASTSVATTPDVGLFPRRAWIRAVERALRARPTLPSTTGTTVDGSSCAWP